MPRELNEAEGIAPGVAEIVRRTIDLCAELGADVGECELPRSVEYGLACYYLIAPAEASSNLARYDGVRYGLRVPAENYYEMVARTRDAGFGDEPKRRIMLGTYALSAGYYDAYYGQAQKVRTVIAREFDSAFERFDVLVSPTSPTVAFKLGEKAADPLAMYLADVLTIPPNMAGLPGLSIPCGLSEGLPVGLQLIGPQFAENTLFRAGHALEAGARLRHRAGAAAVKTIVDRAADFVLAVERVFGVRPRVLDGSRAVQIEDVRLSLEAGERELCLIRMHGALEEYLAIFEVRGDIEVPLLRAKEYLHA